MTNVPFAVVEVTGGSINANVSALPKATNQPYGAVGVLSTATLIKAANTNRKAILIKNNSTQNVFLGQNSSVTISNGQVIAPGETFFDDSYTGDIYGIVAGGSADVRYTEDV